MQAFKTKEFIASAEDDGILKELPDHVLHEAAYQVTQGLHDGSLGQCTFKKRVPLSSKGKRGGGRAIIAFQIRNDSVFLTYAYKKNKTDSITGKDLEALQFLSKTYLRLLPEQLDRALETGLIIEVKDDNQ